jgi:hypothetical protein
MGCVLEIAGKLGCSWQEAVTEEHAGGRMPGHLYLCRAAVALQACCEGEAVSSFQEFGVPPPVVRQPMNKISVESLLVRATAAAVLPTSDGVRLSSNLNLIYLFLPNTGVNCV